MVGALPGLELRRNPVDADVFFIRVCLGKIMRKLHAQQGIGAQAEGFF